MTRSVAANQSFKTMCTIDGKEGDHFIIRKGKKTSRVIKVGEAGEGEKVETAKITREWETPKPENPQAPA